jgi:hypothetical protein
VVIEQVLDIALEGTQAASQKVEVLAGVAHLQLIGLAMVAAHGARGRRVQGRGDSSPILWRPS